ncbi:MAG: UvrD-helicase domain-containing protein, partial [Gammaproteobacteria bacterium]|nr:UvrD-helicase domain-containing protein [Gammaproteobacteria bacterium]
MRLDYPQSFTICDRNEQESLARAALREIKAPNDALRPGDLLGMIGRWKMNSIHPPEAVSIAETDREHLAAVGYRRYQQSLKTVGAVDFDDLLLLTEELFTQFPSVRRDEAARFDHVLIDEYQDTNQSQYQIVRGLAMGHRNLCVVGDDDQSIYAWRGAEVAHILRFHKDWPDAKIVRLEDNYRSTEAILNYANTLIVFNRTRHEKMLKASRRGGERPRVLQCNDETEEAEQVVADICNRLGEGGWELGRPTTTSSARREKKPLLQPKDMAILFRTNEQPRIFETALRQANVPYVLIGGMSFFDRREVRDILAYLRVIQNPNDEPSLRRILNQPPRGISDVARKRIADAAIAAGKPLWEFLAEARQVEGISAKAAEAILRFRNLMQSFRSGGEKQSIEALVREVVERIGYHGELARTYPNPDDRESRTAALEEIINAAANFDSRSSKRKGEPGQSPGFLRLTAFLDDLLLAERDDSED